MVVWVRNKLFDINWLRSYKFDVVTISIGNISTGGTGKTPHILWLNRLLNNSTTAILSRGYGRSSNTFEEVLLTSTVKEVGDEPLMMKYNLQNSNIFVFADRVVGITHILNQQPETTTILLDDCFQHRFLTPSFSILLTTYEDPFYEDFLLPSGNLREQRSGAERAHAIVVSKCPLSLSSVEKEKFETRIKEYSSADIYFSSLNYFPAKHHISGEWINSNSEVILLSGIANSKYLEEHIQLTHTILEHVSYNDHHHYNIHNLERLKKKVEAAGDANIVVVTTEKDYVKLRTDAKLFKAIKEMPTYLLSIEVVFLFDGQEKLLKQINKL